MNHNKPIQRSVLKESARSVRGGFTYMEVLVVAILMSGVVTMLSQFWKNYSLATIDLASRCVISRELQFVTEYLSRDFGNAVGATAVDDAGLLICQDALDSPNGQADWASPDTLIEYYVEDRKLYRSNYSDDTDIAVAQNILSFQVLNTDGTGLEMAVTVQSYDRTEEMTFFWTQP